MRDLSPDAFGVEVVKSSLTPLSATFSDVNVLLLLRSPGGQR